MKPRLFRNRPVVVEAIQFDGSDECVVAMREAFGRERIRADRPGSLLIDTPEGILILQRGGSWVVRDAAGDVHLIRADIFDATYEEVGPDAAEGRV